MESTPDTTPVDELIREVRKAMQSTGDRVQELRFPVVNQNTAWWVCSPWQVGEVGFQSLASDILEV